MSTSPVFQPLPPSEDESLDSGPTHSIAVIGLAGRFPGAANVAELWDILVHGREGIRHFDEAEMLAAGVSAQVLAAPSYVKACGFLENPEYFDADFFGYAPREAEQLDPQQRLFLEQAWVALEDAGYDPNQFTGHRSVIGLFAGSGSNLYFLLNVAPHANPSFNHHGAIDQRAIASNDKDFLATRTAYKLNLRGPVMSVQTACSTSLVTIHQAIQSLLSGECDMALAGGVAVHAYGPAGYLFTEGGILSPDGHCRAFDAEAHGTVPSSGVGVVVLKRLADALRDHDHVYAVVNGSAINNDGADKMGYTAPSVAGQVAAISEAQALAGVTSSQIGYIEAHGTGTQLGDPIELSALGRVFGPATHSAPTCAIGSIKTNLGHLDAAAGVTGFIKTALALHHKVIPPSLHFANPNPKFNMAQSPFYVPTTAQAWPNGDHPRTAGVSSFGIGGTNAHVVLSEAPAPAHNPHAPTQCQLIPLSAKTPEALKQAQQNLAHYLAAHPELKLADIAHTLQAGRKAFDHRLALVADSIDAATQALAASAASPAPSIAKRVIQPVFMFPGQGSQYPRMGMALYARYDIFRQHFDEAVDVFNRHLDFDLRQMLTAEDASQPTHPIHQTWVTQPALFCTQYALAQLWLAWGIRPAAMIGHSIGEFVAATLAGVFTLEDAARVVAVRGLLMRSLPGGAMLGVGLPADAVQQQFAALFATQQVSLAAINAPAQCVVSGNASAIAAIEAELSAQDIACRNLRTSHAFHSHMMTPILDAFRQVVSSVTLSPPMLPYVSNVTGDWVQAADVCNPDYWVNHLRGTVQFSSGVQKLLADPAHVLLEVGPSKTLCTLARQHSTEHNGPHSQRQIASLPQPRHAAAEAEDLLKALGQLWSWGAEVNWASVRADEPAWRVSLPTYPFQRQRFWLEPTTPNAAAPGKRADLSQWFYVQSWKQAVLMPCESALPATWLVCAEADDAVAQAVAHGLRAAGHMCIQAMPSAAPGAPFAQLNPHTFAIDPANPASYAALQQALALRGLTVHRCVSFWGLGISGDPNVAAQATALYVRMLALAQFLGGLSAAQPVQFAAITNQLCDVTGDEAIAPAAATVLGVLKAMPYEFPNVQATHIDVVVPLATSSQSDQTTAALLAELSRATWDEAVAWRGKRRWLPCYEPVPQPNSSTQTLSQQAKPNQTRKTIVITGGLGGQGLAIATRLAQDASVGAPHTFVLVGRSALPAPADWDAWLHTHDDADATAQKIRRLQAIQALGAQVSVQCADVADAPALQRIMAQARAEFGDIHGVVHAAGESHDGLMQLADPLAVPSAFASKVQGVTHLLAVLDALAKDSAGPQWVALCSSLRSQMGGLGQAEYCSANAFMDAMARTAHAYPILAIGWDAWKESGMSQRTVAQLGGDASLLADGMTDAEGCEIFVRALRVGLPHLAISTTDLAQRLQHARVQSTRLAQAMPNAGGPSVPKLYPRPHLPVAYTAAQTPTEQTLVAAWEAVLGMAPIGIHDNYFELGGDSVMGVRVVAHARAAGLKLTPRQLFECQTIVELALEATPMPSAVTTAPESSSQPSAFLPIESWLLQSGRQQLNHFNQAMVFEVPALEDALAQHIETALHHVCQHHQAFALRYVQTDGVWHKQFASQGTVLCSVTTHDLSARASDVEVDAAIDTIVRALHNGLDLAHGPLLQAALVARGPQQAGLLFIVAHHLAVDFASWPVLMADVSLAVAQLRQGREVVLPDVPTPLLAWANTCAQRAHEDHLTAAAAHWLGEAFADLPALALVPSSSQTSRQKWTTMLDAATTEALLRELPKTLRTCTEDLLLIVTASVLGQTCGLDRLLVDIEVDMREYASVDLSRTVGWLTALVPFYFDLRTNALIEHSLLRNAKQQRNDIATLGMDYGLLKMGDEKGHENAQNLTRLPAAAVCFMYAGVVGETRQAEAGAMFHPTNYATGQWRGDLNTSSHALEVQAICINGQLHVDWIVGDTPGLSAAIQVAAQLFAEEIAVLIARNRNTEHALQPEDFSLALFDQDSLNTALAQIEFN